MVFEKIKNILADQLEIEEESINMESDIAEDLGADSIDVVDLVMSIEDEFEIEAPDDAVDSMKTVGDVVKFVEDSI